jgi:sugar O-acyltransferase (sialic acid O-acetyltransferase NeuD family)
MRTQTSSTLVILGAGGHGRVAADAALAQGFTQVTATDRDPARWGVELVPGVPVVGVQNVPHDVPMHVAIGNAAAREREVRALGAHPLHSIVHPKASVSASAQVGAGCLLAAQCVVGPNARLGESVIVNHGAVVDHDCEVGAFSHIAPLASLSGGARVGRRVLVGTGARVLPGVQVGDDIEIGAGAVVTVSLHQPGVYVGVPARRTR